MLVCVSDATALTVLEEALQSQCDIGAIVIPGQPDHELASRTPDSTLFGKVVMGIVLLRDQGTINI
jgi:hypothetical protein